MTLSRFNKPVPTIFDRFFDADPFQWAEKFNNGLSVPAVNIKESAEGFEVALAAPGLSREDFKIELDKDTLTISSEKKHEQKTEGEKFTRREFSYQSFRRAFTLPGTVDAEKISAKYEQGILNISIPKRDEAKVRPVREIEIG
jgi:HSP20 family protein